MEEPIFLSPACKDYLWGGRRLWEEYGKGSARGTTAETWELSTHPDGASILRSGVSAGMTLDEYLSLEGNQEILGANCAGVSGLPVLIKFIDAAKNLSVQVHPDDGYAQWVEGEKGKTEMWYIVDCDPGAAIYYGTRRNLTRRELAQSMESGAILTLLNRVEVQPGQVYFIPAGTLHAMGAGVLAVEIQQSSNCTYRVYDYGRLGADGKPRALHLEKALDVAQRTPTPPTPQFPDRRVPGGSVRKLWSCDYFAADLVTVTGGLVANVGNASFRHLLLLKGKGILETQSGTYPIQKGDSILLPASLGRYEVRGECQFILTKLDRTLQQG